MMLIISWLRRSARSACVIVLLLFAGVGASLVLAWAAEGPFGDFHGHWSGTGTIKPSDKPTERIRCEATYRPRGSTQHEIDLQLRCDSDSYKFDLNGQFQADENNHISGSFTERTRSVGGTVVGNGQGPRIQIHVESSGFSATMVIVTTGARQAVNIDAQGGGQFVKASITLRRG
jgi:hypothetical protein